MGETAPAGPPARVTSDVVDRGRRLFEFLAAAQQLRMSPVRTTETYERDGAVYWLGDLPEHPAVTTAAALVQPAADEPVLIVQRVAALDAPAPGAVLERWLSGPTDDPDRPPVLLESFRDVIGDLKTSPAPDQEDGDDLVWLSDNPAIIEAHELWREQWNAWADKELMDRPVRVLYKTLFSTYTSSVNQTEELELVLAVGCLGWSPTDAERVRRHLLTTPAVIDFDEATGALVVTPEPTQDSLTVELDMLEPARHPSAARLNDVVTMAREQETHPLDRAATGDLIRRLAFSLDADARYDEGDHRPSISGTPVAAFAPAIILRRRSQRGLVAVFKRIAAAIAESNSVPAGLLPLLDPDQQPSAQLDPQSGAMVEVDDEVFLPLPLNDRQLDIIRRVDRQAQTLVQGPPGTGKTHLAAALISHLLAQGKRVLVTAHTDRALKEVRAKLPETIKPLAVSVVGTERADMADLKVAVERISTRSSDSDPETAQEEAHAADLGCLERIDSLRRQRASLRNRLVEGRAGDVAERSHATYIGTLAAIARTYHEQSAAYEWILRYAQPQADTPSPLSTDDAVHWLDLLQDRELLADEPDASRRLIELSHLPSPAGFAQLLEQQAVDATSHETWQSWTQHPAFDHVRSLEPSARTDLQHRMTEIANRIRTFEQRHEQWMSQALRDIRSGRVATWYGRGKSIERMLHEAWTKLQQLPQTTQVTIADGVEPFTVESLARHLHDHVQANGPVKVNPDGSVKLGPFVGKAIKQSRPLFEGVRLNGRPPTTIQQLDALITHLELEQQLDAVDRAWPAEVQVPHEDTLHERFQWHATELQQLNELLELGRQLEAEQRWFAQSGLPQPDWNDLSSVLAFAYVVDAAASYDAHLASREPLIQLEAVLDSVCAWDDAADAARRIHLATQSHDRGEYASAHARMSRLHAVRQLAAERDGLTLSVHRAAPELADAVTTEPQLSEWTQWLPGLPQAWDWARTGEWILSLETADSNELQQQIDVLEQRLRGEIEKLAGIRAWRHALAPDRLTGRARADLQQYAQLVRRLGKGSGKYASARRAEVRQAMDRCRPAVPVWIMPIYRIAEQLQVAENMFDVVIVDEASQAGLEATFLQYLAPKIVVIGDDKQVSPSAVGVDQQELRDLAAHYLWDDRYKASWQDPKRSLFDEANMRFGAKRTLIEHRRCVPEIIGFSNRIAYEPDNIRLVPVRQFGADRLSPIKVVPVNQGYETGGTGNRINQPEAEAVVEQIQKCLIDPRYDGKTFGVVSLSGAVQAKTIKNLLLERLAPEDWAERDLRCGDAADFQGSERDVMFLSMVSAPEPGQRIYARTQESDVQRYNVAASRAKDQMWVFHSIPLSQLTNSQDMRFQLLDYCYEIASRGLAETEGTTFGVVPEDQLVRPFDSLFEQRVYNRIVDRGYLVHPQYEAMGYRIDLVVIGAKGRLAIECDGDAWHGPEAYEKDLARQRDLQRCGWQFFRIRESAYYVDPHAALSGLWQTLEELEIRESGWIDETATEPQESADVDVDHAFVEPEEAQVLTVSQVIAEAPTDGDEAEPEISDIKELEPDDFEIEEVPEPSRSAAEQLPSSPRPRRSRFTPTPARVLGTDGGQVVGPLSSTTQSVTHDGDSLQTYRKYEGWAPATADAGRGQVLRVLRDIVAVEGPVLGSRIHEAYVIASGGHRVGKQIASTLNRGLSLAVRQGMLVSDDPLRRPGVRTQTFRLPDQPEVVARTLGPRDLDQVPPGEMSQLLASSAETVGWESTENLFREALNRLGRTRLTTGVRATFGTMMPLLDEQLGLGEAAGAREPAGQVLAEGPRAAVASEPVPLVGPRAEPGHRGRVSISAPEPVSSAALEQEFHRAMVNVYRKANDQAGYNATRFVGMLSEHGGLRVARRLLAAPAVSAGFTALWELKRLDLTVEALVLEMRFAPLFTEDEIRVARDRLGEHGHH